MLATMDQLPCNWTHEAKEFMAELGNEAPFEQERLNRLRGLAKRVRVLRISSVVSTTQFPYAGATTWIGVVVESR